MSTVIGKAPPIVRGEKATYTSFGALADRWIYVFMAGLFVVVTLIGFVPDSLMKVALVDSGQRPAFPPILHLHAVLMGSFLLLVLAQSWLAATGRTAYHMQLGMAAFVLVPALVVVGFMLIPAMGHQLAEQLATAPPAARAKIEALLLRRENVMLIQMRLGISFPLLVGIALYARRRDAGLHKRLMMLATASTMSPSVGRMLWLPTTMPGSYLSSEIYCLLLLAPLVVWDLWRNRRLHRAYAIWAACTLPLAIVLHALWDTPWWHAVAHRLLTA